MDEAIVGRPRRGARHLEWWVPLVVVVLDQITKWLVRTKIPLYSSVSVIPDFLDLTHVRNTGAAFGFLNAVEFPGKTIVIALVAMTASCIAAFLLFSLLLRK